MTCLGVAMSRRIGVPMRDRKRGRSCQAHRASTRGPAPSWRRGAPRGRSRASRRSTSATEPDGGERLPAARVSQPIRWRPRCRSVAPCRSGQQPGRQRATGRPGRLRRSARGPKGGSGCRSARSPLAKPAASSDRQSATGRFCRGDRHQGEPLDLAPAPPLGAGVRPASGILGSRRVHHGDAGTAVLGDALRLQSLRLGLAHAPGNNASMQVAIAHGIQPSRDGRPFR